MKYTWNTQGTCSRQIQLDVEDGVIRDCCFIGGCNGNTQGVSKLVIGQKLDEVIARLEGIRCGARPTSCPDQLAQALKAIQQQ